MRRIINPPLRPFQEGNPEVWVELGEEPQNIGTDIRETVQELKDEMA